MSDNRNLVKSSTEAEYNSLTAAINYEYSKIHGYDFLYYRPYLDNKEEIKLLNCKNPKTGKLRHAAWSKLLSTSLAFELGYEYVCYIDSDCIFKDFNKTLLDFINPYSDKDIIFLNNKPWGDDKPCSGFYVCKINEGSKQFVKDWYDTSVPAKDVNHAWEQEPLWDIYTNYNVAIIDSWMFQEENNQFLRHVTANEKHCRVSYFTNFIKLKNIDYVNNIEAIRISEFDTNSLVTVPEGIIENEEIPAESTTVNMPNVKYPISNKKYSWENSSIRFFDNGSMEAFGSGSFSQQETYTYQALFGGRSHTLVFNEDYSEFKSVRLDDNYIVNGKLL